MPNIKLAELAAILGMDKSHARKYILKKGISFLRERDEKTGNQLVLTVTPEDAETIIEERRKDGYRVGNAQGKPIQNGVGFFYIVRLIPELAPNRVKLGFAVDVNARLQAHRTSAPTAELITSWACRASWEQAAIASITRESCRLIASEVYECDNILTLVDRGNQFFAIMPQL